MLRVINESWDKWLDEVFDRHLIQIVIGMLLTAAIMFLLLFGAAVHWVTMRSVEAQLFLRDLDIKTLRQQQEANQRDINRLIDEQYYIKEEMRRMRR